MASYRYVPEWMQGRSDASHRGWETRWERMWELGEFEKLGPKGQRYVEQQYGVEVKGEAYPEDYYDEYESPFDYEIEY